jgi:hypothetical protein
MAVRQSGEAIGRKSGPPAADGFITDAEKIGEFDLGVA